MRNIVTDAKDALVRYGVHAGDIALDDYASLVLGIGRLATPEDVHAARCVALNRVEPGHDDIVPYGYLRAERHDEYAATMQLVRRAAESLRDAASGVVGP